MPHYAAGVLPVTWHRGTALFLVGEDVRDGAFADFGGKCERVDKNDPAATAARELVEETYGMVGDCRALRQRLVPSNCLLLRSRTQNGHPYFMFVAQLAYAPHLRVAFHRALAFLRHKNLHKTLVETTDVRWVTLDTLLGEALPKRAVFAATLQQHAAILRRVAEAPDAWRGVCAGCAAQQEAECRAAAHPHPSGLALPWRARAVEDRVEDKAT